MKQIYLMRHSYAEYSYGMKDRNRHLTAQGIQKAHKVGAFLAAQNCQLDLCLLSPANRVLETAEVVQEYVTMPSNIVTIEQGIYGATEQNLMRIISKLDESVNHIMLIGHNPAISSFTSRLANESMIFNEADVALLTTTKSWEELYWGDAQKVSFWQLS